MYSFDETACILVIAVSEDKLNICMMKFLLFVTQECLFVCGFFFLLVHGIGCSMIRASVRRTYAVYYVQKSAAYAEITHQRRTADF